MGQILDWFVAVLDEPLFQLVPSPEIALIQKKLGPLITAVSRPRRTAYNENESYESKYHPEVDCFNPDPCYDWPRRDRLVAGGFSQFAGGLGTALPSGPKDARSHQPSRPSRRQCRRPAAPLE